MSQEPVKENIPYSWASVAYVKAYHYGALAHYFAATLLIDHQRKARSGLWACYLWGMLSWQGTAFLLEHVCTTKTQGVKDTLTQVAATEACGMQG